MSEPPTTRSNADGFTGDYPKADNDWEAELYRQNGMEAPWLLEYEDGKPVLDENGKPKLAPRPDRGRMRP
ncbi:hypothetical protein [Leifsonia sp. NPDC058248]|uniref:hypothetical protein n=1 Tax=Leifsonia sp. NPDC058248 TaxID=3346402 RepID=UPI0036DDC797